MHDDMFFVPHGEDRFVIYMPFKGVVTLGNGALVEVFQRAQKGDPDALQKLGVSRQFFQIETGYEQAIKRGSSNRAHLPFAPQSVSLFLTNNCPLRCQYCYAEGGKNKLNMPWEIVVGVLDEVANNASASGSGKITVNFHGGGDVTSAWGLLVRTRTYLSDLALKHSLKPYTTIGLSGILNADQSEWIVRNIDGATISLDGDLPNNAHRVMADGNPSFPLVDATLKRFDDASYSYGLRCTVTETTVGNLPEIVRFFCENYKVKNIKVEPMFPAGRATSTGVRAPMADIFIENFREAQKVAQQYGRTLIYSGARINTLSNVFCQAAGDACAVTPEGHITSCYEVLDVDNPHADHFFYGHYDRLAGKMVVDETKRRNLFRLTVQNRPECDSCYCKWHCAGDCPVKVMHKELLEEGTYPDRCYINRTLTKDQLLALIEETPLA